MWVLKCNEHDIIVLYICVPPKFSGKTVINGYRTFVRDHLPYRHIFVKNSISKYAIKHCRIVCQVGNENHKTI